MTDKENSKIERAKQLAIEAHKHQKYGDKPYQFHLQEVVNILLRFGFRDDAVLLSAAWLHDSLEDTNLSREQLESEVGFEVAELVWSVTDEEGQNRKERKDKTYQKIKKLEKAIILKLADRIANAESSIRDNKGLFQMYAKEQSAFSSNLRPNSTGEKSAQLWQHLDNIFLNKND